MSTNFNYTLDGKKLFNRESSMTKLTVNFTKEEFDCKCGCGTGTISEMLVNRLQMVRDDYGKSMIITSGIRCLSHNRNIGSRDTSSHIKFIAADIGCKSMSERHDLLKYCLKFFDRVGVHKEFLHVDVDYDKPQGVFVY